MAAKQAAREAMIPAEWRLSSEILARWNNTNGVMDFFDKEAGVLTKEEREMTECTATEALEVRRTD